MFDVVGHRLSNMDAGCFEFSQQNTPRQFASSKVFYRVSFSCVCVNILSADIFSAGLLF